MTLDEKETLKSLVDGVMEAIQRVARVPEDHRFGLRRVVTRVASEAFRLGVSSSEARRQSSMEMQVVRLDRDG